MQVSRSTMRTSRVVVTPSVVRHELIKNNSAMQIATNAKIAMSALFSSECFILFNFDSDSFFSFENIH